MAQERFLILGAGSFYGSNFARYVEEHGDSVTRCRHYDCIDAEADYIVNFASKSLVAESWDAPEEWVRANVEDFTTVVSALVGERLKKFVHVSTPEVYGHMEGWSDETHRFNPSTPYAVTRAAGDMMLMAYHRFRGIPTLITRTANIYGPGQPEHRLIPLAFRTLRNGQKMLLHGGGTTMRSFIHVRDACAATYLLAKQGAVGETYHISTRMASSMNYVVETICAQLALDPKEWIGEQPERLGKDKAYLLSTNKIRALGWSDTITLEKGLQEWAEKSIS